MLKDGTFATLNTQKTPKRKLRDTALGSWLTEKAPSVLDAVGEVLPDKGVLGVVKNLVDRQPAMSHEDRMEFERLLMSERQATEMEMTKRWQADMASDSRLANTMLAFLLD